MSSIFKIPSGVPDLTNQIEMDRYAIGFHDVTFKGIWNTPYKSSPSQVAVLFMKTRDRSDGEIAQMGDYFRGKLKVWGRLQHEHILSLLGLSYGYGPLPGLVSPWMDNGTLVDFLRKRHNTLTRYELFRLLEDIALALQYLHAIPVVHGNLASLNILVDSHGRAFVRGSGLSTILAEITESEASPGQVKAPIGHVQWTAPELVTDIYNSSSQLPTSKSDVWSFGCIMIHVLSGQVPWSDVQPFGIINCLVQNYAPPFPQEIMEKDSYFLQQCFSRRPAERPSADQILAFIRGESLRCLSGTQHTTGVRSTHNGIPDVMTEFKRRVSDQLPSHLIYIPAMRLISRQEVIGILKPEMITEEDISEHGGWSRQSAIESKVAKMLKYAILSHRWGESEPTFQDLKSEKREGAVSRLMNDMEELRIRREFRSFAKSRGVACEKLFEFCTKAKEHGCLFAWSDTCCINKESSSELDEAIRSMYRWYRDAYICIVYLARSQSLDTLDQDEWFLLGWTLQELLAPPRMKFYGPSWAPFTHNENDKDDTTFIFALSKVTNIPPNDLCNFRPGPNRAWEKMTWAANRKTTRIEDIAYSLIGIFDISMTIAYGEGDRAFKRFMEELIQNCKEWQILVWAGGLPGYPTEPACYRPGSEVASHIFKNHQISWWGEGCGDSDFTVTKRGVQVRLLMVPASVEQTLGQSIFLSRPAGCTNSFPLVNLVVRSQSFPPASTTEWAIGIVNYHDHREADKGRLKLGENYMCFLLRRFRRPGMDTVRNHWRREVTEEILTVLCAEDFEQTLETVWL